MCEQAPRGACRSGRCGHGSLPQAGQQGAAGCCQSLGSLLTFLQAQSWLQPCERAVWELPNPCCSGCGLCTGRRGPRQSSRGFAERILRPLVTACLRLCRNTPRRSPSCGMTLRGKCEVSVFLPACRPIRKGLISGAYLLRAGTPVRTAQIGEEKELGRFYGRWTSQHPRTKYFLCQLVEAVVSTHVPTPGRNWWPGAGGSVLSLSHGSRPEAACLVLGTKPWVVTGWPQGSWLVTPGWADVELLGAPCRGGVAMTARGRGQQARCVPQAPSEHQQEKPREPAPFPGR